ncbi:MAG TPA: hypothetical protein VF768_00360 [Holophagaceae bacterium]
MRKVWLLAALAAAPLWAAPVSWESLQARGVRLGAIEIRIQNVFDLSDPVQNTWIGRLANTLHLRTREGVIRRMIPFKSGELVDARRIRETERDLRSYRFIKDAHIDPEPRPDGTVAAVVWVRDAWTLKASVGYSQVGGQASWGFALRDRNLLGSGKDLGVCYDRTPDERSTTFLYQDRQLFGSRWTLSAAYQTLSDGRGRGLDLARPFFLLDTPWAVAGSVGDRQSVLRIYDRQQLAFSAPSVAAHASFSAAWLVRLEGATALRLGIQVVGQDQRYGPLDVGPAGPGLALPDLSPRRLRGPALTVSWIQDRYRSFRDLQGMDTPEDYNLGWSGSGVLGLYTRAWGATGDGPFTQVDLAKGWAAGPKRLVLGQGSFSGRYLGARLENALGSTSWTVYDWRWPHQVLAANTQVDATHRPDPENLLSLGGQDGLRGYPNYLHLGDRRWLASVEDRILTDWRWLGMLRAGFVVYADAGAIRRLDGTGWTRPYADLGAGLRFGDLKSSLARVVLLTVAVPLTRQPGQDRYQVLVGNTARF